MDLRTVPLEHGTRIIDGYLFVHKDFTTGHHNWGRPEIRISLANSGQVPHNDMIDSTHSAALSACAVSMTLCV